MTRKTMFAVQQEEARKGLRKLLKGQHQILTLAEWTGSTAYVRLFIVKNNELRDITHFAGDAMGEKTAHAVNKPYGFKRGGYGYGKEFDVVYGLGSALYPNGHKHTAKNCHSNDHSNGVEAKIHRDGGYKFNQRSI